MKRFIVYISLVCVAFLCACNRPSRVEQYRAEKYQRDSIALIEQQRTLTYYESQLESLMPVADSLIALFSYERNEKYQDHGFYVTTGKNNLRILVRDDGKDLLLYRDGKRIKEADDPKITRARELQVVISDVHELEIRIRRTSLEIQKYEKRLEKH